jgi:alkylation response protein AidB-like acyl-CoA dehydrogenase
MTIRRLGLDDVAHLVAFSAEAPRALSILDAIGELSRSVIGARGFTMFRYRRATAEVERIHSSDPVAYPLGGRKRIADFPLNQLVLARGEVYIAANRDAIRATYKDAETIFSLGVGSIMNVPVRIGGVNIGACNLFGGENQFDSGDAADARILAAFMAPAIQALNHLDGDVR